MAKNTIVQVNMLNPTTGEYQQTVSPETEGAAVMMATGNDLETDMSILNGQLQGISDFLDNPLTVNVNNSASSPVNVTLPASAQVKINNTSDSPVPVNVANEVTVKPGGTPLNVTPSKGSSISINNESTNPIPTKDTSYTLAAGQLLNLTTTSITVDGAGVSGVVLSAYSTNTDTILYGNTGAEFLELLPGQTVILPVSSVSVKSNSGSQKLGMVKLQ